MKKLFIPSVIGMSLIFSATENMVYADELHNKEQYVSKEQYDQLQDEMTQLKKQVQFLLQQRSQQPVKQQDIAELKQEVETLKTQNEALDDGSTGFLLTGYAFAGYTDLGNANSSFNAAFNPIFLWRLREDLLFEGEVEFEIPDAGTTEVGLEYAQLSYILNDYITFGAGKFLNPSNYFIERLHPAWINKLPDKPITMVGNNRLQANSQLGFQVRGGIPIGSTRARYAFYVSNGPSIRADGSLSFKDFADSNNSKAVGGHISWLPIAGLELGYGFEVAGVADPSNNGNTLDVTTHVVDFNYSQSSQLIWGNIDLRAQYANRQIDRSSILAFNNHSSGGYGQIAYRPSLSGLPYIRDMETVLRYDWINLPNAIGFNDEQRWTIGLNYYLAPSTMVKFAYQFDNKQGAVDANGPLFQVTSGF